MPQPHNALPLVILDRCKSRIKLIPKATVDTFGEAIMVDANDIRLKSRKAGAAVELWQELGLYALNCE